MGQVIWETLPAHVVDLDNVVVMTLATDIEEAEFFGKGYITATEMVTRSGVMLLHNETGVTQWIHWGSTSGEIVNTVVVDVESLTLDILQTLWLAGVIDGDCPEVANFVV